MSSFRKFTAALSALAVSMTSVFTFSVAVAATTFTDSSSISSWALNSVTSLADDGVLSGRPDGSFDPKGQLNRAEMAKVAVLAAGLTTDTTGAPHFNDVASADWFYDFVETLYNNGVVGGINGGALDTNGMATYNPAGTLNRAEGSKILVDAFDLETAYAGTPPNFPDVASSAWFYDYVETAYAHGLLNGYDNGNFGPADPITREQVAVIAQNSRVEAADGSQRRSTYTAGAASSVEPTTPPPAASDGTLNVSLSSSTPASASIPYDASGVEFAKFDLTASSAGSVTLTSIVLHRGGLGSDTSVANVVLYSDGVRVSKSKTFTSSDDNATINLLSGGLVIPAGTTKSIVVAGTVGPVGDANNEFYIEVVGATAVLSNAKGVSGSFPVKAKTMQIASVGANTLAIKNDGVPSAVKLGQQNAEIAKFKINNTASNSDMNLRSITFKEEGTVDETSELANFKLYVDGLEVASTSKIADKYLTFNLSSPLLVKASKTLSAVIKADITGGASKYINFQIEGAFDVKATDLQYNSGAGVTFAVFNTANDGSAAAKRVAVEAGELSLVAIDAPSNIIRADKDDIVLGSIKVTSAAGKGLELQRVAITITNTGTDNVDSIFETGSIEIYDGTSVYDLTTVTGAASKSVTYSDSDLSIALPSTGDLTLQIRGNTNTVAGGFATATDAVLTVSVSSIGGSTKASSGFYVEETDDDTAVTDITPSSMTFKTISGAGATATVSVITQSTTKSAVIGSTDIEGHIFEIKASDASDLTLDTVKVTGTVVDNSSTYTITVSGVDESVNPATADLTLGTETIAIDLTATENTNTSAATFIASAINADASFTASSSGAVVTYAWDVACGANCSTYSAAAVEAAIDAVTTTDDVALTQGVANDGTDTAIDNTRVTSLSLYKEGETTPLDSVSGSQIASGGIATFDGFNVKIGQNQSQRFVVKYDIINDENQANDTIALSLTELQLADDDNDDLATVSYNGGTPAYTAISAASTRTTTIKGVGTLTATVDNTDDATNKAKYVLGGTTSDFVASYEFTALNEGVQLNDLTIANSAANSMNTAISEVILYKEDKTTEIARKSVTSDTVTFTDINYVIAEGSENVYVKVVASSMGKDKAGAVLSSMTLTLDVDEAEGADSGKLIADATVTVTGASNAFSTIPTRISSIASVASQSGTTVASSLSNGSNNLAIVKLTTDASVNTDKDTGASLKTLLKTVKFDLSTDATITDLTIEKIGGTGANTTRPNIATKTVILTPTIVSASAAQTDTVYINGTAYSFTSDATPDADEIVAGFVSAITTVGANANVTATGTSTLILTVKTDKTAAISASANLVTTAPGGTGVASVNGTSPAFDLTNDTLFGTNDEISNSSTVYYLVKGTVAGLTDSTKKYAQLKMGDLDSSYVTYSSDDTNSTGLDYGLQRTALYLDINNLDFDKVSQ